jgi:hypothetical protein
MMPVLTTSTEPKSRARVNPLLIWRYGFSLVLLAVGLWLVITAPTLGAASGRTLGWIVMGYALVRLAIGWLTDRGKARI